MNQDDNSNKIGVVAATLMVAGNMMGSGVFMLPANLAAIGGVAVFLRLIILAHVFLSKVISPKCRRSAS